MSDGISINNFIQLGNKKSNDLRLKLVTNNVDLNRMLTSTEINRPGLSLTGYFDFFAYDRVQIFGLGESSYIYDSIKKSNKKNLSKFFKYSPSCCVFTHDREIPGEVIKLAEKNNVPLLTSRHPTGTFIKLAEQFLADQLAPRIVMHGVLVEVFGVGIIISGKSGVGKSECALELIERGHRLVADDLINIKKVSGNILVGEGHAFIKHYMEIRGLGVININKLFGIRAIRDSKKIDLVITLEHWVEKKEYDRLGGDEKFVEILGLDIPTLTIPVRPGRNIPIIIETSAINERLKKMGFFSIKDFENEINTMLQKEKVKDK